MWKKVLAWISIPIALLLSVSLLRMLFAMLGEEPKGAAGHRFGCILGQGVAAFAVGTVLFLWWRWLLRTLKPPPDAMPRHGVVWTYWASSCLRMPGKWRGWTTTAPCARSRYICRCACLTLSDCS
jgi:hypothetical protein